jgi:hypothetical protein
MDVLDRLKGHLDRDVAQLDGIAYEYPGCCLIISNIARVVSRSLDIVGKRALSTCFSRVSSPHQPAGARAHGSVEFKCD